MKKKEFLNILTDNLNLSKEDKEEILYDYKEHFQVGYELGKTDEEIIKELGDPKKIAKQYMASELIEIAKEKPTIKNLLRSILAALGLGLFNLLFAFAFIFAISVLGFSLLIVSGAIGFSGVALILSPILNIISFFTLPELPYIILFFVGLALSSFGILSFKGILYLNNKFYNKVLEYIQINIEIIKNKK